MKGCNCGNNIRVGFDNSAKMFNFLVFLNFVFVQKTLTLHLLYLQWVESNEFHVYRDKTVGIRKQQIEDTMVTKADDMVTKILSMSALATIVYSIRCNRISTVFIRVALYIRGK